jgi:hypothetical protein
MKEPDLEEERLLASARGLKLTIERRSMEKQVKPVKISGPGGDVTEATLESTGPGKWASTVDVKIPGLYKIETPGPDNTTLTAVAHAGSEDPREMSEVVATDEKLKPLAEAMGSGTFWTKSSGLLASDDPAKVDLPRVTLLSSAKVMAGSGWMGLRDREAYVTRGVKLTAMFTGFLALAALLVLLSLAWWREGK